MFLDRLTGALRWGTWRRERNLRVCETLSLGSRGFLAVVRYEKQKFLVGGTNQSIAMLAELVSPATSAPNRRAVLEETDLEG
jgi:flagellar biogenesis protein FliO